MEVENSKQMEEKVHMLWDMNQIDLFQKQKGGECDCERRAG